MTVRRLTSICKAPVAVLLVLAIACSCTEDFGSGAGNIEEFPLPDEFVPVEELPEPIHLCAADYPEIARQAGLTCTIWVRVLIDKEGVVRYATIESVTAPGCGFEEAALEAAMCSTWSPAVQNGQPVAVWVVYKIEFTLN